MFGALVLLPLAPVRGVVWLGRQLEAEAQRQLSDPARIREQLAAIEAAYDAGRLSSDERDRMQDDLVARLLVRGGGG